MKVRSSHNYIDLQYWEINTSSHAYQRINFLGVPTKIVHSITHTCEVYHNWHTSKILKNNQILEHNFLDKISNSSLHRSSCKIKPRNFRRYTCNRTRAGLNGISTCFGALFSQSMIFSTSSLVTWKLSQLRIADSRSILIEYGSLSDQHMNKMLVLNDVQYELALP